jgi:tetratricopeptide (TPR) repeat protein
MPSFVAMKLSISRRTAIGIIIVISAGVYLSALSNGFVYDDEAQVLNNHWIRDIKHLPEIFFSDVRGFRGEGVSNYYRPFMHIIYMINYHIFGLNPIGFHLTNVIFHTGVSVLVFFIASMLLRQTPPTSALFQRERVVWRAFFASLLFATHPIHTEAVAWIGGMSELSFTFFYLLSFYLYANSETKIGGGFILSTISFFLAALCKETALTLPILLFTYDYFFSKSKIVNLKSKITRYLPYLIVICLYFILRVYAIGGIAPLKIHSELSAYQCVINIFPLFMQYLEKLILPVNLNVFHIFHPISSIFEWKGAISIVAAIVFIIAIYFLRRVKRIASLSLLWIVISLLPVLYTPALGENIFAERYLYLPSVGFALIASAAIESFAHSREWKISYPAAVSIWLIATSLYSFGTIKRNYIWRDNYTLWYDTVEKSPDGAYPNNNLGKAYYDMGLIDKAMEHYEIAVKLKPDYPEAHNNFGITYHIKGKTDKAIEHFMIALQISPNFPEAHSNIGVVYQSNGLMDKAIEHYIDALKLKPNNPVAHNNLGRAYYDKGLMDKATEHYRIALRLRPEFPEAKKNLKNVLEVFRENR